MPAMLKSGLPKPVCSALPMLQSPGQGRELHYPPLILLKSPLTARHSLSTRAAWRKNQPATASATDPQIYTEWANHYLAKSGHKILVKDLRQDMADGVLLAEIIQVIANEKIADINDYPQSHSEMIENIDACLGFLAAKGVNIKGLCAEEIRSGNLNTILGLFFNLSLYKQQQQQQAAVKQLNQEATALQSPQAQGSSGAAQPDHPSAGPDVQASPCTQHGSRTPGPAAVAETQSRLPGPSFRALGTAAESRRFQRVHNKRSQSLNHSDKARTPRADCAQDTDEAGLSPVVGSYSSPVPAPSCTTVAADSTTNTTSTKGWRSKSLSARHSATSSTPSVKHSSSVTLVAPAKLIAQQSMLDKLKLFNSRPAALEDPKAAMHPDPDGASVCHVLHDANLGNQQPVSLRSSSPKLALKSMAHRTLGRALGPTVSSGKAADNDKDKRNGKEKAIRCSSGTDQDQVQDGREEARKLAKGSKSRKHSKKEGSFSSQSGIPKPAQLGKGSRVVKATVAPPCGRGREQPCSFRAGGVVPLHNCPTDKNSSTSSLTSSEEKDGQNRSYNVAQSVDNNIANNAASDTVSVQKPLPQLQHSQPNTATVTPFMYRSQTDMEKAEVKEDENGMKERSVLHNKPIHTSLESLAGDDTESRRLRSDKNVADLRQNLEETMSSLRHTTHISHSTLETTFDNCITTDISGRGLLNLSPRPSSALSWRHGLSSPRLQAGDAALLGRGYGQRNAHCAHRHTSLTPADKLRDLDVSNKVEELAGITTKTAGYMGKLGRTDSATSGWDDSSSVSSGISDAPDTDDLCTSVSMRSYITTPSGPRRNTEEQLQTDTEKRTAIEHNPLWNDEDLRRPDGCSDTSVKMDAGSRWCHAPSVFSDESECNLTGCKTTSQTGSWRWGMSGQMGVTKALTNCSSLKVHGNGKTDDAKVSEKGRISPRPNGLPISPPPRQINVTEGKKLLSKKPLSSSATVTTSGAVVTGGSSPLGKMPLSTGITATRLVGRQTSVDDGYLPPNARTTLQYRSLPRPSRANRSMGTVHAANRPTAYGINPSIISKGTTTLPNPKSRRCPTGAANQTDREKGVLSDAEIPAAGLEPAASGGTLTGQGQPGKRTGAKYPDMSSPTMCRYAHLPQGRDSENARDWLRSHSAAGLQDSGSSSPFSPAASLSSPTGTRLNITTTGSTPTAMPMNLATSRTSSGLANQDGPHDPHSDYRPRHTSVSSEEKNRAMSNSGSFREVLEEVHGSSLSLVSSTSSVYSTPDEKSQSEIRKLRRELEASQEKVSTLTMQLSANAHLVAAFEQSLGNMSIRLQSLTTTAEQKDTELNELRKTIDMMKKQNCMTQAASSRMFITPAQRSTDSSSGSQPMEELQIQQPCSSDSIATVSNCSNVAGGLEHDAKNRKKRRNWLRSSFKQAFGKKSVVRSASSHSDVEEGTDSSQPASPRLQYGRTPASGPLLRLSQSSSLISECMDSDAETVMHLRSELRDKDMKLTDIRLEALSSAHQLDQLRESMSRMQMEIEKLKTENDRLRMDTRGSCSATTAQGPLTPPTLGLPPQINLTESTSLDMLLEDSGDGCSWSEGSHVKVVVSMETEPRKEDCRPRHFLIGCIGVSGKTKWEVLDGVVRRLFKEYITNVDPVSHLDLSADSVLGYSIGDVHRTGPTHTPELLPCGYLVGDSDTISVRLKGAAENSQDTLAFETLIPKAVLQRCVSQLREHGRVILSGPPGTGKTFLAARLAEHLVLLEGHSLADRAITTFSIDNNSRKEVKHYLSNLTEACGSSSGAGTRTPPRVIILDNLHHLGPLGDVFNGLLSCKHHRCPYVIGTMNRVASSAPNLHLYHNFRWVLYANHTEPVKGFLGRFLRRKLLETEIGSRVRNGELVKIIEWIPCVWQHLNRFLEMHSSSDVTIGPRLFLSCPMDVEGSQVWFTDLWNYSIIPYLLEAVREGLQLYGRKAAWEDPACWVMESYPWTPISLQPCWSSLLHLRPEDVGFDGYGPARVPGLGQQTTQDSSEADPLMNMLMSLKEASQCAGPPSYDSNSNLDDVLDPS
ncbi:neuron navigator 2 isoform X2 [Electrophorus electricus]|uniref:neuron navigator 2 isoform X2 n=1 Tax=Electrophorus electricus TaxID=8005 RepID=UPI0015CFD7E4|nr:neuron navigator 2 isoform X2 [Electrophorus electricus]